MGAVASMGRSCSFSGGFGLGRRRGRGRASGKAEIGKAESENRKAQGVVVSGSFLPSPSSHSSRRDFRFQLLPLLSALWFQVSAFQPSAAWPVEHRALGFLLAVDEFDQAPNEGGTIGRNSFPQDLANLWPDPFTGRPEASQAFCGSPLRVNHPEEDGAIGLVNRHSDQVGQPRTREGCPICGETHRWRIRLALNPPASVVAAPLKENVGGSRL